MKKQFILLKIAKNMEVQKLRKEISQLIDNVKEHADRVTDFERIPQLELEIILSKIRKLYEKSVVFNYLYQSESSIGNRESLEINQQEEIVEKTSIVEPSKVFSQEEKINEKNRMIKEEVPVRKVDEKSAEKTLNDINSRLKEKNVAQGSINERIGQNKLYSSLSSKLQSNPISDLPKAIGVNERFLFIKELFGGETQSFYDAVVRLNNLQNYAQAEQILNMEYAVKYNWKAESPTVKNFVELVQRRYI